MYANGFSLFRCFSAVISGLALALFLFPTNSSAQSYQGGVRGAVADPQGGVVANGRSA